MFAAGRRQWSQGEQAWARSEGLHEEDETEPAGARERILAAAYALFSQHGVAAVGIDAIIARSGTAKMSLYRHFGSKDELVLAFLRQREQEWTRNWLEAAVMARASGAGSAPARDLRRVSRVVPGR